MRGVKKCCTILWRMEAHAPQKCHYLWRMWLHAPQNCAAPNHWCRAHHISVAPGAICGAPYSMRHRKGDVGCNPAVGCGAHRISVAHGARCATECLMLVAHVLQVRHRKAKSSGAWQVVRDKKKLVVHEILVRHKIAFHL